VRTLSRLSIAGVREPLLREHYGGGQSFFVAPRISDLARDRGIPEDRGPESEPAIAHGQMGPKLLEEVLTAFYDANWTYLSPPTS